MSRAHLTVCAAILVEAAAIVGTSAAAPARRKLPHPAGAPAAFLTQIVQFLAANRYAEAWLSPNRLQQSIAPLHGFTQLWARPRRSMTRRSRSPSATSTSTRGRTSPRRTTSRTVLLNND
jgi:hypothetical protein